MKECVQVAGAEPFFLYKPKTKKAPSLLLLWLGWKAPPLQDWCQELGLVAGGSSPLFCMNYPFLILKPINPQTLTHSHTKQLNLFFLRRAFTDMHP